MELLPLIIVFGVMMIPMLLLSNRQRKVQRQRQEMVNLLGVGDEVRTHSGFYGLIVESYGNFVVLETESGALLKWDRAAISTKVDAEGRPVAPGEVAEHAGAEAEEDAMAPTDAERDDLAIQRDDLDRDDLDRDDLGRGDLSRDGAGHDDLPRYDRDVDPLSAEPLPERTRPRDTLR